MDRHALDEFSRRHGLPAPAAAAALRLTGLAPDAPAWRGFAVNALRATGLGALGAGLLFFVAANWQQFHLLGRFALLESGLLACVVVALRRSPPAVAGQAALVLGTLLVGGLLALFGQSYQTGADLYELFFVWAALSLPFAFAGGSGALWAVWWSVLNIGLELWVAWLGDTGHFFWRLLDVPGLDRGVMSMGPAIIDLLAALAFVRLGRSRFAAAAPLWLARCLGSLGAISGTVSMLAVVTGGFRDDDGGQGWRSAVVVLFIGVSAAVAVLTWTRKRDVFPMALLAASWITVSTTWLVESLKFTFAPAFFVVALWLIAASTGSGMLLMHWFRTWRATATVASEVAA